MDLSVDLHSHSGASGGVGNISLEQVCQTMQKKGIGVFGTGDALHDGWLQTLENSLKEEEKGLYSLDGYSGNMRFLIQTEIIITAPVQGGGRKITHTVILFPDIKCAKEICSLFDKWSVKRNIGRPFLACEDSSDVAAKLYDIKNVDQAIEIIPAHVLTPQGIYGSNNPVNSMADFYGEGAKFIKAVETGLSADPQVLALIPELDNITLMSSSDCHCGALNRVGREYTTLSVKDVSYESIISALHNRDITCTAEFTPAEGRFFLTGHRAGKKGHTDGEYCYFSPDTVPDGNICPVCGKMLTVGVLQRALELSKIQGEGRTLDNVEPAQKFFHMIPLVEAVAACVGVKSCTSKKVTSIFNKIIDEVESEAKFWRMSVNEMLMALKNIDEEKLQPVMKSIFMGDYTFSPLGYDGEYGALKVGEKADWFGQKEVFNNNKNVKIHKLF
jgi:PHP family Zn ribbon phosphoesterase